MTDDQASASIPFTPGDYYDILLLGKHGQGKSTLGNKLLQVEKDQEMLVKGAGDSKRQPFTGFLTPSKAVDEQDQPSYEKCQLATNERTRTRVLDTPGFSPGDMDTGESVYEKNLKITRWIVCELLKNDMRVQRVLYFLPERGVPEKIDGSLQEELKVIYQYFGIEVFNHMVVMLTVHKRYQHMGFPDKDGAYDKVRKVFSEAVTKATGSGFTTCPPLVYISLGDDDDHTCKIKDAEVLDKDNIFMPPPRTQDLVCTRCASKIRCTGDKKQLMPVCEASSQAIVSQEQNTGELTKKYEESTCHPFFVRKYNQVEKIIGGVGHIVTLGIPYGIAAIRGTREPWPFFFNTDEICPHCNNPPGYKGCCPVLKPLKIQEQTVKVNHSLPIWN